MNILPPIFGVFLTFRRTSGKLKGRNGRGKKCGMNKRERCGRLQHRGKVALGATIKENIGKKCSRKEQQVEI